MNITDLNLYFQVITCSLQSKVKKVDHINLKHYFHIHVCASTCPYGGVTLQCFITLIAPEALTALVPGAPEPRMYPHSGYFLVIDITWNEKFC